MSVMLYGSVVSGVASAALASAQSVTSKSSGATTVAAAVAADQKLSALDGTSIGFAAFTALAAGFTTAFAKVRSDKQERIDTIASVLRKLTSSPPQQVDESDVTRWCDYVPAP